MISWRRANRTRLRVSFGGPFTDDDAERGDVYFGVTVINESGHDVRLKFVSFELNGIITTTDPDDMPSDLPARSAVNFNVCPDIPADAQPLRTVELFVWTATGDRFRGRWSVRIVPSLSATPASD